MESDPIDFDPIDFLLAEGGLDVVVGCGNRVDIFIAHFLQGQCRQ